jgi:hypothetical protein
MARYQGDDQRAANVHTQSLATLRALGNRFAFALALNWYSRDVAVPRHRYDEAVELFNESLLLSREVRSRWQSEQSLEGLAQVASARGQYAHAARLFGAAEAQRKIVGQRYELAHQTSHDKWIALARVGLGDTIFAQVWGEDRATALDKAVEYALAWVEPEKSTKPRQPGSRPKGDP